MSVMPVMNTNRFQGQNYNNQIKSTQSFKGENPPQKVETKKTNKVVTKLVIGAGIITLGIIGYKKGWGKSIKKFLSKAEVQPKDGTPKAPPEGMKILLAENPKTKKFATTEGDYVNFEEVKP